MRADADGNDTDGLAPPAWLPPLLALVGIAATGLLIHHLAWEVPHIHDDVSLLLTAGLKREQFLGWWQYVSPAYNLHWAPLYRVLYYFEAGWFGLNPRPWHQLVTLAHLAGAGCVFVIVRHYAGPIAALVGSVLWAGAAIGRWDNPHVWIATAAIPFAWLLLLLAMVAATRYRGPRSGTWSIAMGTCLAISIGSFGPMLLLAPAILGLLIFFEAARPADGRRFLSWGLAWLLPVLVGIGLQVTAVLPRAWGELSNQPALDPISLILRIGAQLAVTLSNLLWRDAAGNPSDYLAVDVPIALGLCALMELAPRPARRVVIGGFLLAAMYLATVNIARPNLPLEVALTWGRYLYLPTIVWCLVLGALAERAWQSTRGWGRIVLAALALPALAGFVWQQRRVTTQAVAQAEQTFAAEIGQLRANQAVVHWLNREGARHREVIKFPEMPVIWGSVGEVFFPLSVFLALVEPGEDANVAVAPGNLLPPREIDRALAALKQCPEPAARTWAEITSRVARFQEQLRWLSAMAEKRGLPFRLPNFDVEIGNLRFPLAQLVGFGFTAGLPGIRIVPESELSPAEVSDTLLALRATGSVDGAFWRGVFENVERRRAAAKTNGNPPGPAAAPAQ